MASSGGAMRAGLHQEGAFCAAPGDINHSRDTDLYLQWPRACVVGAPRGISRFSLEITGAGRGVRGFVEVAPLTF